MADKGRKKVCSRIYVCFVWLLFSCFSVEPQEIPLPDTFINPAFQVAHHLCQSMMKLAGHPIPSNDRLLDGCADQINKVFSCFLAMAEVGCWACDKQTRKMITTAYFKEGKTTQIIKELNKVHKPSYILATPQHTLYISSFLLDQVLFVADTRQTGTPAVTFTQGHGLDGPWGMVADDKYLYVASFTTDQIHKYDLQTKRFVAAFGNESYLDCPEGMALGPNNTLYVASFLDDRVVKFSLPDGAFLGVVADRSHGLKGPEDVALLPDGSLLICSHYTDAVMRFNPSTGEKLGVFAKVEKPVGLTVGSDGNVYVTSYVTNSILRLDGQTGEFIDVYATGGGLEGPSSVSFADLRTLYAASYDSDRVVLYNSTSGFSYTLPGKRNEQPGNGSFRNTTRDR